MLLVVLGPALGLVGGWLLGGRVRRMGDVRLRAIWLVWVAAALQLLQYWTPYKRFFDNSLGSSPVLLSYSVLALWLLWNVVASQGPLRAALAVVAGGWLLNYVVIATDGAMPVSRWAMGEAGMGRFASRNAVADGHLFKHMLATSTTSMRWLGDALPLRPLHAVVSVGDVLLWLGVAAAMAAAMRSSGAATPA